MEMRVARFVSIEKKLLFGILAISTTVTSLFTLVSFYYDYRSEMDSLAQMFNQIEVGSLPAISSSVWDMDDSKITTHLESIVAIGDVMSAEILDPDGKVIQHSQSKGMHATYTFTRSFELLHNVDPIGTLNLVVSKSQIYGRLLHRLVMFFFTQLLKTLIVSSVTVLFIRRIVVRPLKIFTGFLRENRDLTPTMERPFELNRSTKYPDELQLVFETYNHKLIQLKRLHSDNESLIKSQSAEIKEKDARAIESARLASLGEVASGIAHEINNPLAVISGSTEILLEFLSENLKDTELNLSATKQLERIRKMVDRISKIIKTMRLSARDASNDPFLDTPVTDLISDAVTLCESRLKEQNIRFEVVNLCPPETVVRCRRSQISQVLVNLLNNAHDAIEHVEDKWIELKVTETSNHENIQISVTDCGHGLSPEIIQKIFQPFFTTKEVGKGTGLGLSIARRLIDEHGGKLEIDPAATNTRFVFSLTNPMPTKQAA